MRVVRHLKTRLHNVSSTLGLALQFTVQRFKEWMKTYRFDELLDGDRLAELVETLLRLIGGRVE